MPLTEYQDDAIKEVLRKLAQLAALCPEDSRAQQLVLDAVGSIAGVPGALKKNTPAE